LTMKGLLRQEYAGDGVVVPWARAEACWDLLSRASGVYGGTPPLGWLG
jgi:hypothetical protein